MDSNRTQPDRLDLAFTGIPVFLRSPIVTDLANLDADFAFLGFPSDEGTGWYPGSRFGPRSIREMSLRFASCNTGATAGFWDIDENKRYLQEEVEQKRIVDCGDVDVIYTRPDLTWDKGTEAVRQIIAGGALPLIGGGDHAATFSVARAFDHPFQVVHFDAHLDYQPYAHSVQHSHGNPIRKVKELPNVRSLTQVGIRSYRSVQEDYLDSVRDGNFVLTTKQYQAGGNDRLFPTLQPDLPVYLSVDVDVLDMTLAPGVGTPEPSGLLYDQLRDAMCGIADEFDVCGLDMVELNPLMDSANKSTAFLTTQLMVEFMGHVAQRRAGLRPAATNQSANGSR
ncbi:MAG: agmatinase [Mycobacterium sp.]|nr:agmatinase [Mycobacterium sp.]